MTSTTEQTETAHDTKATKKATAGARRANVAAAKSKARQNAVQSFMAWRAKLLLDDEV
jgi:hypothetical protein